MNFLLLLKGWGGGVFIFELTGTARSFRQII